jgi:hypothetical protein
MTGSYGPKKGKECGQFSICHKEHYDLCTLPTTVKRGKSKRLQWAGCVVHMGETRIHTQFWL